MHRRAMTAVSPHAVTGRWGCARMSSTVSLRRGVRQWRVQGRGNRAALALLVAGELALAAAADAKVERSNLLNGVTVAPCLLDIIVKSAGCRGGEVKMRDIIER